MVLGVLLSLLLTIAGLAYFWLRSKYTYFARNGFLFREPKFPFGNIKGIAQTLHLADILKSQYEEFKDQAPAHGMMFFTSPTIIVTDLDVIKDILIKEFNNFHNRGMYFNERDDILSAHLFAMEGEKWRAMRASLSPTFTSGKMKMMFNTLLDISNVFVECTGNEINNEVVEVKELLAKFSTDVIGNVAFGLESNSLKDPDTMFRKMGQRFFKLSRAEQIRFFIVSIFKDAARWLGASITPKEVTEFFLNIIRETIDYRKNNKVERKDFMELLLKVKNIDGSDLTFNEIAAQSFVFWIAGFETSSSTAAFCMYNLATNPETQENLRNEIKTVLSKHNNEITYEGMLEMKYLQMVIDGEKASSDGLQLTL